MGTLYTERNSSIVDMRCICLLFICVALFNFCSMAPLNDDEYVYEDVPVWKPAQGKDLTLFEAVPNMLALMMTSVDSVRYRKERFVGNEFIMDQTLTIIFFKITLFPSSQLVKFV